LAFSTSLGQQAWPKGVDACGDTSKLLRKSNGKVVWFSPKQMNAMAINRAAPPFPPMCRCQGAVVVAVVVNLDGNVACSHVISGHPLLTAASIQAANKWTFKPLAKRGAKVSFVGLLMFTFHSDGTVTY
jgi:outer membrane biosynthesis protein TonB